MTLLLTCKITMICANHSNVPSTGLVFALVKKMSAKCFNNVSYIFRLVRHGHNGAALKQMLSKETFMITSLELLLVQPMS